ncbi:PTS sugar transporter subunit IIA [Lacticaseibacillus daqingensis]|uniref:PTS sugar transporter subunit IIA n=1 Tax=Lacticaseibacillus daqingensis TaxID=2486014 RepID=UPI000F7B0ABD|nr:PTS sugar transporter subunit IIA [Lacticaseibacillus daqingensis]
MNIDSRLIFLNVDFSDKFELIDFLTQKLQEADYVVAPEKDFKAHILQREADTSTDMGNDIAIPHAKSKDIRKPFVAYARLQESIVWNEKQGSRVSMVFMLGVPDQSENGVHLQMLSSLARKLIDNDFLLTIKQEDDPTKVAQLLAE